MEDRAAEALTSDQIAEAEFPQAWRGYEPHEVRRFLKTVASAFESAQHGPADDDFRAQIREAQAQVEQLRAQLQQAPPPAAAAAPGELDDEAIIDRLGEECANILRTAREAGTTIYREAEQRAAAVETEARSDAERIRAEAEAGAKRRLEDADRQALAIRAEGEAEKQKAQQEAAAIIEAAEERARLLVSQARSQREELEREIQAAQGRFEEQRRQLEVGRSRISDAYEAVRAALATAGEELPPLQLSPLERVAVTETVSPAGAGSPPEAGSAEAGSVDPGSAEAGSVDPGSVDPGSADPGSVDPGSADPVSLPGAVVEPEPAVAAEHAASVEPELAATSEPPEPPEPAAQPPHEAQAQPEAQPERAPQPGAEAADDARPEPDAAPAAQAGAFGIELPDDMKGGLEAFISEQAADDAPAASADEPPSDPGEFAADVAPQNDETARVDELFEEIRQERAVAASRPAEADAAESDVVPGTYDDEVAAAPADEVSPEVAQARERLAPLQACEVELVRSLKRTLADEQNVALEALRELDQETATAADVLPPADSQRQVYADTAAEHIAVASHCGAAAAGHAGISAAVLAGGIEAITMALASELSAALHEGVAAALARGRTPDERADLVRATYREWRVQRLAEMARHYAIAAYNRAIYDVVPVEDSFVWTPDPEAVKCPSCDENYGAARHKGEAFPSGHVLPPAAAGCRCHLVPA